MKKVLAVLASLVMGLACLLMATGCAPVEQLAFGKELVRLKSQLDTLTQLKAGSIDVSVIDSVMAGYYTSQGDFVNDLQVVDGLVFAEETYGIGGRKEDRALVSKINEALIATRTGKYADVAAKYGLTSEVAVKENTTNPITDATDNSWNKIKEDKKLIIGYTVFAPIAFPGTDSNLTGFDIELAKEIVAYLNTAYSAEIEVTFQEINWSAKEALLIDGTIDLVWNGMTITEERSANMCMSIPYLYNKQVAVIRKADKDVYTSKESMANAIIGVEGGSAGEGVVLGK